MKNKLFVLVFLSLLFMVGCSNINNTPSKEVETFFEKYRKLDNDVITQLDVSIDNDSNMDNDQKNEYKTLIEKQYQNLSYKISNEKIEGDTAFVDTEIEVYNYIGSINKSKDYYNNHKDKFNGDNDLEELRNYINYKIDNLKKTKDKITYEITFNLNKKDGKWVLQDISDSDREKINGLY